MTTNNNGSAIVRTGRGLSIAGTRITLYSILDYVHAGWPPKLIQDWLGLTDVQIGDALAYLETHRAEVEQESQQVVRQAAETRHYWEQQAQLHHARRKPTVLTPEQEDLRAKFEAWKAQRESA